MDQGSEEYKIYSGAEFEWKLRSGETCRARIEVSSELNVRIIFQDGSYHSYPIEYLLRDLKAAKAKQLKQGE